MGEVGQHRQVAVDVLVGVGRASARASGVDRLPDAPVGEMDAPQVGDVPADAGPRLRRVRRQRPVVGVPGARVEAVGAPGQAGPPRGRLDAVGEPGAQRGRLAAPLKHREMSKNCPGGIGVR